MIENWKQSKANLEEALEELKKMDEEIESIKIWETDRNNIFNLK